MKAVKTLYPLTTIKRTAPANLKDGDEVFFGNRPFHFTLTQSSLVNLQNVLVTSQGIILKRFLPLKRFIVCYDIDFKNYMLRYVLHVIRKYKKIKTDNSKNYLLIFDNYSGPKGFYHWISDGLTRLIEMEPELHNYAVLVPEYFKNEALYTDTLCLFNIQNIFYIPEKTIVGVKNLYVADFIAQTGNFNPTNILKLQKHIWAKYKIENKQAYEKIYISREKASRRHVINEPKVIDVLGEMGFRTVCLEDLTFGEQIALAFETKYFVSIHGAALTHILFMQPQSNVFEFKRLNDASNYVYFSLADVCTVNYYYQFCEVTERSKNANNFDLTVDLEELKLNLHLMLNPKP